MEIIDEMKPASAEKLTDAVARLKGLPLWIHPCCGSSVSDLAGQIHDFSASHPMDLIVIDSLDFLNFSNTADAVAGLKAMSIKLNVPILLLATVRSRRMKFSLADLSAGIVDQVDTVLILDRSREKAKYDTPESGASVQLYVEKNRLGYTGCVLFRFFPITMLFTEGDHKNEIQEEV